VQKNGFVQRFSAAAFDVSTADYTAFDPELDNSVETISVSNGSVYCGGNFHLCNVQIRNNLAAFDASTGSLLPAWTPITGGEVKTLALANNSLYVGGSFGWVHDTANYVNNAANFDLVTGDEKPWKPELNGPVNTLVPFGNIIYAGGNFTSVSGGSVPRGSAAAFDLGNGNPNGWNPDLNGEVFSISPYNGEVYIGGSFTTANGTIPCAHAGAFDATAGILRSSWNPSPDGTVRAIDAFNGKVYFIGQFTSVTGGLRMGAASFDTAGSLNSWDPGLDSSALSLYRTGSTFFIGGIFSYVNSGSVHAPFLACVDSVTGLADGTWLPNPGDSPNNPVTEINMAGRKVFIGGNFSALSNLPYIGYAQIECPVSAYTATITPTITVTLTVTPTITLTSTITQTLTPDLTLTVQAIASATPETPYPDANDSYVFPQPAQEAATFVYALDATSQVTITIYDFSGGIVKSASFSGTANRRNKAVVDVSSLRAGPYFYMIKVKPASGPEKKYNLSKFYVKR